MDHAFLKLPNGRIVSCDPAGFIRVTVDVELSTFIDNDLDGVLGTLSMEATGTELLSNISYSVVGHQGNTLSISVVGSVEMIDDAEEVPERDLPRIDFEVDVTRIGYGHRTVTISARTEDEAVNLADDDAGNHEYPESSSEYEFVVRAPQ